VVGAFDERHETGRLLEHEPQPLALAAISGQPVQHESAIQQCAGIVT